MTQQYTLTINTDIDPTTLDALTQSGCIISHNIITTIEKFGGETRKEEFIIVLLPEGTQQGEIKEDEQDGSETGSGVDGWSISTRYTIGDLVFEHQTQEWNTLPGVSSSMKLVEILE